MGLQAIGLTTRRRFGNRETGRRVVSDRRIGGLLGGNRPDGNLETSG